MANAEQMGCGEKWANAEQMHSVQGHHAADGALPMLLAVVSVASHRNAWFTTDGVAAMSVEEAAHIADPYQETADGSRTGKDPLLEQAWPREVRESVWEQLVGWSASEIDWGVALAASKL